MTKTELEEAVFQALGEASMCWSKTPSGVFEDVRVIEIGNKLVAAIMELQDKAQDLHAVIETKIARAVIARERGIIKLLEGHSGDNHDAEECSHCWKFYGMGAALALIKGEQK